jgi:hypothetical protein
MHSILLKSMAPILRICLLRRIGFDQNAIDGLSFKIASSVDEKQAAFELVHQMYKRCGVVDSSQGPVKPLTAYFLPTTTTFIAKLGDQVIGAVSLVEDNRLGLPMEGTHSEEVAQLRATFC